jgi:dethiobiotin synthetase
VSLFITGTDTGVGKTFTVTQILRLLSLVGRRAAGMKPICCGDRGDAELLLAAGCNGLTIEQINPVWYKTPVAPFAAAQIENVEFKLDPILDAFAALQESVEHVFVEGVGGWLVPITSSFYVSDLARALQLPVLVVAENKLGCLNHTLLTLESIEKSGLPCVAVALNDPPGHTDIAIATNRDVLKQLCPVPVLTNLDEKASFFPPDWLGIRGLEKRPLLSA